MTQDYLNTGQTPELPFFRSYRVRKGLIAGAYPGSAQRIEAEAKLEALANAGVTLVVCLMEEHERDRSGDPFVDYMPLLAKYGDRVGRQIRQIRYPIVDGGTTTPENMRRVVRTIDEEIKRGGIVYVHCWGGRGRTGSVICCWLIAQGLVPDAALAELQHLVAQKPVFQPTPENQEQIEFIRGYSH